DRMPPKIVAPVTAVGAAVLLVAARFALGPHWLYYVLYAGLDICAVLLSMQFWLAAGERFSAREAKKVFTIIAASGTAATITVGLVVSAIVSRTGAENLLFGCAAFQIVVAVLATVLGRRPPTEVAARPRVQQTSGQPAGSRHLDLLGPLLMFGMLGVTLIDFQFKSIANAAYAGDRVGMVRFFGLLYVVTAAAALVIQLLFTRKILARFGVAGALLLLPVTLGLGAIALLLAPSLFTATASKAADTTFRSSVDSSGQQLLYLPAPPAERSRRKRRIDMLIKPGTEGSVGVALLAYKSYLTTRTPLAIAAIVAITAWIALVLRMRGAYVKSVADTLRRRRIPAPDEEGDTGLAAEASRAIKQALSSTDAAVVRRGIDLARLDPAGVRDELRDLLTHSDAAVRGDAFACLADVAGGLTDTELAAALDGADPTMAASAAATMYRRGDLDRRTEMVERARAWLADPVKQALGFAIAEQIADVRLAEPVRVHLGSRHARHAIRALVAIGEPALAHVHPLLDVDDDAVAAEAIRIVGMIAAPDAVDRLVSILQDKREVRRAAAAAALARLRRDHPDRSPPPAAIVDACMTEISRAFVAMAAAAGLGHAESIMKPDGTRIEVPFVTDDLAGPAALLSRALRERSERARDRVFDLLAALEPELEIATVRANLRDPDPTRRANAVELLDARSWPRSVAELKPLALAIVDDSSRDAKLAAASKKLRLPRYDRAGWIDNLLADRNPWIRACTAYYAGAARDQGARPRIEKLTTDPNPLVAETARHALASIDRTPETKKMLTTAEKVLFLKGAELFAAIPAEDVAAIATAAEEVSFEEGEVIFAAGDPGDSLYLVVEGKVRIAAGERTLAELGTREVFGEMAILDPAPRSATAVATAPVVAVRLGQDDFSDVLAERPEVAAGVLRVLVRRLRTANVASG
ncbi:MAG TPA: cyclic nucleotide-binding domain-containing protein, partial [Kofleriaceae bacterium]|nr:cyclic nucleotide-binding domain-containing protein [Kofleriaceae bacterium]